MDPEEDLEEEDSDWGYEDEEDLYDDEIWDDEEDDWDDNDYQYRDEPGFEPSWLFFGVQ